MRYLDFMIGFGWVLVILCILILFWCAAHDDSAWAKFALKHHCLEVMSYPDVMPEMHRAYLCDDGITYIKAD